MKIRAMEKLHICILPLLALITLCHCQDPTVKIVETSPDTIIINNQKVIEAQQDKDVTIDCHVEQKPVNVLVRWQRSQPRGNGLSPLLTDIAENEGANDNTKYGVEKPTQFTWRLRIKTIHPSDYGEYKCYVQIIQQTKMADVRLVQVYAPPIFDPAQTSTDMTVREGDENVELMCNASGTPTPSVEWRKQGGKPLPIGGIMYQGSKMNIPVVRYSHRGIYHCRAFNKMGVIKRDITLKVRFKPQIVVTKTTVYQAVGYQIELQCFIEANPYPKEADIKWVRTRAGEGIKTISYADDEEYKVNKFEGAFNRLTYELIIYSVTEQDFGTYECQVKNNEGSSTQKIVLEKSDVPYKSVKLGKIINDGAPSGASPQRNSLLAVVLCLSATFYQLL